MPAKKKSQNRHPVDMLFDTREAIKALQEVERRCKEEIMTSGNYVGDEHVCVPKTSSRKTLDRGMLEKKFGIDAVATCMKESSVTTLNLFNKADIAAVQ